jgi:AraC-like DNA-binding protein
MVCNRCIMVVENIFNNAGIKPESVALGKVTLEKSPTAAELTQIEKNLEAVGFEILTDQKKQLVERIKSEVTKRIQGDLSEQRFNFSQILSSTLNKDYSSLSKLFSEAEGITIEKFIIDQKIERAKEMLAYGEKNMNDIAFELGYSSLAHFSTQFKKITGFTPSEFKKLKNHHRRPLDDIGNP